VMSHLSHRWTQPVGAEFPIHNLSPGLEPIPTGLREQSEAPGEVADRYS
jgi:hypothetical protein